MQALLLTTINTLSFSQCISTTFEDDQHPFSKRTNASAALVGWLVECCFTCTETIDLLGTGAQDGHLTFTQLLSSYEQHQYINTS